MIGCLLQACLAVAASHAAAHFGPLKVEVQYLQWTEPLPERVETLRSALFGVKVPGDAKVFATMTVAAEVGKPFYAQARFDKDVVEVSGLVPKIEGTEVILEVTTGRSREMSLGTETSKFYSVLRLPWGEWSRQAFGA